MVVERKKKGLKATLEAVFLSATKLGAQVRRLDVGHLLLNSRAVLCRQRPNQQLTPQMIALPGLGRLQMNTFLNEGWRLHAKRFYSLPV